MKKIYISGKITGDPTYKKKFSEAALKIKCSGNQAVNPAEVNLGEFADWTDYMRTDIKLLCECDGIYMLKDWTQSEGAKLEHEIGQKLKLRIMYEEEPIQEKTTTEKNSEVEELKKENEELKEKYEKQKEINKELVDEMEDVKSQNRRLADMIRKLMCCGNCQHNQPELGPELFCELEEGKCKDKSEWRMRNE